MILKLILIGMVIVAAALSLSAFEWPFGRADKTLALFTDPRVQELAKAAARGDEDGVRAAVKQGASPNAVGSDGSLTPLLYVLSTHRNERGLKALLAAGADPNHISKDGFCPVYLVARGKYPQLLKIILDGDGDPNLSALNKEPVLLVTARDERWENLQILLDHGANINALDGGGYSLLMNLVIARQYERAVAFVQKGADVRVVARNGDSLACLADRVKVRENSPQKPWRDKLLQMLKEQAP